MQKTMKKRFMISAMSSGSGKTVLTCGLLQAFRNRGISVEAFKCGPDYIDPMFHRQVLGLPGGNLDLFLQGKEGVIRTLHRQTADLAVLEGAMGYYDGVSGTTEGSAWDTSRLTNTPVILALKPSGSSITLAAQVRGLMEFRSPSMLAGILLTDCKPMLYAHLKPILERETGLTVLGYLPHMEEAEFGSRYLGLVTPEEISNFQRRIEAVAAQLEETCDLDRLLSLGADGDFSKEEHLYLAMVVPKATIAVARDEAFCFYYRESLAALERAGAQLCYFSPLWGQTLPACQGLYLGGGYPELYLKALSENTSMGKAIADAVKSGLPTVAECGGFLYLQQTVADREGNAYPMAGVLPGDGYGTDRLQRFGYLHLTAESDSMLLRKGECLPAHEFHYWDTTCNGAQLHAQKPNGRTWACGFTSESLYAGFPHLHFDGALPLAQRFVSAAKAYGEGKP